LAALAISVPIQGALVAGRGLGSITEDGVAALAVGDGVGTAILVTTAGLLAMIITAGLPYAGPAKRVACGGAIVAPLGFVLSGHTRTMSPAVAGYLADALHLIGATLWFGGLIGVVWVVRRRRRDDDPFGAAEAIATFSGWAASITAVVVVAGIALSWIEVGSFDALTTTTYGRLLLAKVAVVAVVLAVAAWNRFRLVPQVAAAAIEDPPADDGAGWRRLIRLVRAEVALLAVVLVLTGVLVNVTPAKAANGSGVVTVSAPLGEGTMDVTVDPAEPGRNDIHIFLYDAQGRPADEYDSAAISLELPSEDLGPFDRTPIDAGAGHFQLVGTPLALGGDWSMTVTVKPDRFTEQQATVTFPVG